MAQAETVAAPLEQHGAEQVEVPVRDGSVRVVALASPAELARFEAPQLRPVQPVQAQALALAVTLLQERDSAQQAEFDPPEIQLPVA